MCQIIYDYIKLKKNKDKNQSELVNDEQTTFKESVSLSKPKEELEEQTKTMVKENESPPRTYLLRELRKKEITAQI